MSKKEAIKQLNEVRELWNHEHEVFDKKIITIGDYTYGMPKILSWDDKTKVKIGKFCSLAGDIIILAGGEHRSDFVSTYPFNKLINEFSNIEGHPATKGDITIGNDVWIGDNAKILSGVTIGDGAIIGSSSVVAKDVPAYAIAVGNPAKIIRYRFDQHIIDQLLDIKWWDFSEKDLVKIIPLLQSNDIDKFIKTCYKIKGRKFF